MRYLKPTSPGTRGMTRIEHRKELSGHKKEKALTRGRRRTAGRNADGRITMRHRGGGHKRLWREVDFSFDKKDIPATVRSVEYDPNRSAFIGLAVYKDGEKRYVVLPQHVLPGSTFMVSESVSIEVANRLPLGKMPVGTFIYNVSLKPGGSAVLARSAGNYAEVIAQDAGYTHVRLPSTEVRKIISTAWACVGEASNPENRLVVIGKAGRSRWMGIRPTVRGTAMNPVDHPHGGGEGRSGRGHRRQRTIWGKPAGKGQKTRRPKKYSNVFID